MEIETLKGFLRKESADLFSKHEQQNRILIRQTEELVSRRWLPPACCVVKFGVRARRDVTVFVRHRLRVVAILALITMMLGIAGIII